MGGKPETAQPDGAGNIYVNIEDKSQIIAFDSKTLKVQHTWPVAPSCKDPAGMAIDVEHKRLFVGCRNQLMAVVDYTNGKVVATVPIGKGVDANRFDPATGLAFASCNDGTIAVAHSGFAGQIQRSPDDHDAARGANNGIRHKRPHCLYRDGRIGTATASQTAKSSSLAEGNLEDLHFVDLWPVRATVEASGCGSE
jgi:hypothetical protein